MYKAKLVQRYASAFCNRAFSYSYIANISKILGIEKEGGRFTFNQMLAFCVACELQELSIKMINSRDIVARIVTGDYSDYVRSTPHCILDYNVKLAKQTLGEIIGRLD